MKRVFGDKSAKEKNRKWDKRPIYHLYSTRGYSGGKDYIGFATSMLARGASSVINHGTKDGGPDEKTC